MVTKQYEKITPKKDKVYAKRDTSYSSLWLFNKELDLNSIDLRDKFVNFYDNKELLSEFNPTIAKNIISYWSNEKDYIFDPFAGRTRAIVSYAMNRCYVGYEVSKDAYNYMFDRFIELGLTGKPDFCVTLENKDCIEAKNTESYINFDLIFSCPPYWDLEKYESCPGQLSDIKEYPAFLQQLKTRLDISIDLLKKDGYMCLVVGDFRRKGIYYAFHTDLINMLSLNKRVQLHDVIVIQNIPFNNAAFYFGQNNKYKRTSKCHEYLLVWKKVIG